MNNTWFLIWRREPLQTFHRLLRSFDFRLVALDPMRTGVLHHDCATKLQTRFVFLIEKLYDPPVQHHQLLRYMNTVSSCIRAVPARNSGSLRELTDFTVRIFGKMCKHIVLASWLAFVWSLRPFSDEGRSVDSFLELTLTSSVVCPFWLNYSLFHHDNV